MAVRGYLLNGFAHLKGALTPDLWSWLGLYLHGLWLALCSAVLGVFDLPDLHSFGLKIAVIGTSLVISSSPLKINLEYLIYIFRLMEW